MSQALDPGPVLAAPSPTRSQRTTFGAFLDILLPRDLLSGSATDLGVDAKLWEFSGLDPRFRRLVALGCQWLDMTGGPRFAELRPEQQLILVNWMTTSKWNRVPRRFYELMRQAAIEIYYSEPASWPGLPITHPPQPLGYPPPWP
ncbi:MAG: gluconate 2-dehydrogenase subunit 3 family protein [Thiobacillaceae bacterium]